MDNPLMTPNRIQKLIRLAEDKPLNVSRHLVTQDDLIKLRASQGNHRESNFESSSGILDLEHVEGFGDSTIAIDDSSISLSKSTTFHPGEMTGRSTGAQDMPFGRYSSALDIITNKMDKQSEDVQSVMRNSICTDASFNSKRDLTADEISLLKRQGGLPHLTPINFVETASKSINLSMGSYFKNRCIAFDNLLTNTESPERVSTSMILPSITEVSGSENRSVSMAPNKNLMPLLDQSLDSVPVRQTRKDTYKIPASRNVQNEPLVQNVEQVYPSMSTPIVAKQISTTLNPTSAPLFSSHEALMNTSMRAGVMMKNLHSLKQPSEDLETSIDNSLSISKIADYLGKQSNVSVTEMLKYNNPKKAVTKSSKYPLSELHLNMQEKKIKDQVQVTNLRDTRKTETASSAGTLNTVISLDKLKLSPEEIPEVIITRSSLPKDNEHEIEEKDKHKDRSKSPSSKSRSTMSTVQENFTSFKSADSPTHSSKGEAIESQNISNAPSPNIHYEELDKSVDWHEVLLQKRLKQKRVAEEQWVEFTAFATTGFVGVSCPVTIEVTTLTESWLSAKLQFDNLPNDGKDFTIELPRLPLLLSPGKSEQVTLFITSNIEINTTLPFTMILKDSSIDIEIEQKGCIEINMKMPVIQVMSSDGVNKIIFPPIQEKSSIVKSFVLLSDCPVDLLLDISVVEGDSLFSIKNVQEIKKTDINKVLKDRQGSTEEVQQKGKSKANKQLCRLTSGNAIRVTIKFNSPKLSELQLTDSVASFNGILNVNLIGVNTVLKKVDLKSVVGSVNLVVQAPSEKLHLTNEPTVVTLCNTGSVTGIWIVKPKTNSSESFPFKVTPSKFEIRPGGFKTLNLTYTGPENVVTESGLIFEEINTNNKTTLEICGGTDRPKVFPIKTSHNNLSWVRSGRKELSLKNSSNKRIHIRCQILGDGFSIDMPGVESRGIYCLPFGPNECRPLPIIFAPATGLPHAATLHLVYDKNSDFSRKIKLFGCASGECVTWSGLVTYGDTALLRAVVRSPITLQLYNKSKMPAFVCATIHFNLQYSRASECVEGAGEGCVSGGRRVICGRALHSVGVRVNWSRVERAARAGAGSALATLSVLAGPEFTRRRILRIIKDQSTGELDTSLLPEHLRVLADQYEGEDPKMDNLLAEFNETKAMLQELIVGLQELTAQIDLPPDFSHENTIIISDDTIIEHHTLCD